MLITKELKIDMAHRLPGHKWRCKNLHWHTYRVRIWVEWDLNKEYMVVDYWDVKKILMEEIDWKFDHSVVLYNKDPLLESVENVAEETWISRINPVDFIPTAEKLAEYWYNILEVRFKELWVKLNYVKVRETQTSTAIYSINDKNE